MLSYYSYKRVEVGKNWGSSLTVPTSSSKRTYFFVYPVPKGPCSNVAISYTFRSQRGSHINTLGPEYVLYSYMDPFRLIGGAAQPSGKGVAAAYGCLAFGGRTLPPVSAGKVG